MGAVVGIGGLKSFPCAVYPALLVLYPGISALDVLLKVVCLSCQVTRFLQSSLLIPENRIGGNIGSGK